MLYCGLAFVCFVLMTSLNELKLAHPNGPEYEGTFPPLRLITETEPKRGLEKFKTMHSVQWS
jgi:hypothetical protein